MRASLKQILRSYGQVSDKFGRCQPSLSRSSTPVLDAGFHRHDGTRVHNLFLAPAFGEKLSFVERLKLCESRDLFRPLIIADSRDARKTQREARAILWTALDFIVCHFDDDLWPYSDGVAVVAQLECLQPGRHLGKLFVRETFKRFSHGRISTGIVCYRKMIV